jgi:hypothetical protein
MYFPLYQGLLLHASYDKNPLISIFQHQNIFTYKKVHEALALS